MFMSLAYLIKQGYHSLRAFELDISLQNGTPGGYVSFTTFSHKTAAQVARHGLPLPLVAPIWGLEAPLWALAWQRVSKEAEIDFEDNYQSGKWGSRSMSSKEASKWLTALLTKLDGPVGDVHNTLMFGQSGSKRKSSLGPRPP